MKVRALQMGFFNGRRVRKGTVIEVPEGTTALWLAPVASPAAKAVEVEVDKVKGSGKSKPVALSEVGKGEVKSFTQVNANKAGESLV